jgi:hypothetical protein
MQGDLHAPFSWYVRDAGYEWNVHFDFGPKDQGPILVPCRSTEYFGKRYAPLQRETGLFRIFAGVVPTKEGVLEFAKQYGNLRERPVLHDPEGPTHPLAIGGETYSAWRRGILEMRRALGLWDMVQPVDLVALSRHIVWGNDEVSGKGVVAYDSHPDLNPRRRLKPPDERTRTLIALGDGIPEAWRPASRPEHYIGPALSYLQGVVNAHLKEDVSPVLQTAAQAGGLTMHYRPGNLSGALWLQFALAISGEKNYRRCGECAKWFEISPAASRKDRQFCSNACRTRAYRGRQEWARRMHAGGMPVQKIAKELGASPATVRSWVGPHRR